MPIRVPRSAEERQRLQDCCDALSDAIEALQARGMDNAIIGQALTIAHCTHAHGCGLAVRDILGAVAYGMTMAQALAGKPETEPDPSKS